MTRSETTRASLLVGCATLGPARRAVIFVALAGALCSVAPARAKRAPRVKVCDTRARLDATEFTCGYDDSAAHVDTVHPDNLAKLTALTSLTIQRAPLDDLTPLTQLTRLQTLWLQDLPANDLQPLASLQHLTLLGLAQLPTQDLTPLASLAPTLTELSLERLGRVHSLTPIAALTGLRTLRVRQVPAADLRPLGALTRLQALSLYALPAGATLPDLSRLTALREFNLQGPGPTNLDAALASLTQLPHLRSLFVSVSSPVTLPPFPTSAPLTALTLQGPGVQDLGPVANLRQLTELHLGASAVRDLRPLRSLVHLRILGLARTPVDDIAPLAALTALVSLDLSGTKVRDLRPLLGLANLARLDVSDTPAARDRKQLRALKRALPHLDITR